MSLRLNGGLNSGILVEPTQAPEPAVGASHPVTVALGDVNGDGALDLVSTNDNTRYGTTVGVGTLSVRLNQLSPLRTTLNPTQGPVGSLVTVRGTDMTGATAVSFNGTAAPAGSFNVTSPTTLTVTVPSGTTSGVVTVTTPGEYLPVIPSL
ncbi:hypothetical protein [Hymenobacter cellulosilyticus]|uniref:IPT/TIG domain-containing protein n=1 Tax=Hymenobacter cellulosilyticus TaxID=2932248 RepID=A0A8T9QBD8_9BACT|nr:hypothetical protein [Hymenobacter cellulosilyticus]UOQ73701.1 hypothetical protein MUN79_07205 [Hymenobacter cellulosilyticus]